VSKLIVFAPNKLFFCLQLSMSENIKVFHQCRERSITTEPNPFSSSYKLVFFPQNEDFVGYIGKRFAIKFKIIKKEIPCVDIHKRRETTFKRYERESPT